VRVAGPGKDPTGLIIPIPILSHDGDGPTGLIIPIPILSHDGDGVMCQCPMGGVCSACVLVLKTGPAGSDRAIGLNRAFSSVCSVSLNFSFLRSRTDQLLEELETDEFGVGF
jgi:hypothetical protein